MRMLDVVPCVIMWYLGIRCQNGKRTQGQIHRHSSSCNLKKPYRRSWRLKLFLNKKTPDRMHPLQEAWPWMHAWGSLWILHLADADHDAAGFIAVIEVLADAAQARSGSMIGKRCRHAISKLQGRAITEFSQYSSGRLLRFFGRETTLLPPLTLYGSSHMGCTCMG